MRDTSSVFRLAAGWATGRMDQNSTVNALKTKLTLHHSPQKTDQVVQSEPNQVAYLVKKKKLILSRRFK